MRRLDRREDERQAVEVAARAVQRLALLLDRHQQFAHRAGKTVVEPRALQLRPRHAVGCRQRHRLLAEVRPGAGKAALGAADEGRVERSVLDRRIEHQRGLAAVEGDKRLRKQRRLCLLAGRSVAGGIDARAARADQARQEVEPVHREVEEDQIVDLLERRADDPAMVPVDRRVRGHDVADQPRPAPPRGYRRNAAPSGRSGSPRA